MYEQQKEEVLRRIMETPELQERLRVECIMWRTPVAGIQAILLDKEPQKFRRTFAGMEEIPDGEYAKIVGEWRKKRIGGIASWDSDCRRKYWHPRIGARLFRLKTVEHGWDPRPSWTYYLLLPGDGRHFFLEQKSGADNELSVIEVDDRPLYFSTALNNVMLWKPESAKD